MPAAEPSPPGDLPSVAPTLRALRRRTGLTLETAARAADLSPAHLSRLETGHRQPSLPVLLGLARVYGTTVSELLGEVTPDRQAVIRGEAAVETRAGGWSYRPAGAPGRAMQALRVRIPHSGGPQDQVVRVHPGEEWLHVLAGQLRLNLGDTAHLLGPGDSAHFDSLTPHRLAPEGPDGAELLFVHTLLQSPTAALCLGPEATAGHPTPPGATT